MSDLKTYLEEEIKTAKVNFANLGSVIAVAKKELGKMERQHIALEAMISKLSEDLQDRFPPPDSKDKSGPAK